MNLTDSLRGVDPILVPWSLKDSRFGRLIFIGDHVDILGRSSLNDLILRVAGGKGDQIEDNYVSKIREYADNVKIYEEEGKHESQGLP